MTNVAKWAWQSPAEAKAGAIPPERWWNHTAPIPWHSRYYVKKGWLIVMRFNNGQLVTARAK